MTNATAIHEGRSYELTALEETPRVSAELRSRGYDGNCYAGVSRPVGRERVTLHGLFYRVVADGEFEFVVRVVGSRLRSAG